MVTVNWIINAHKILVTPIVLAMMWYFHNWSAAAFLYLGLHGTYTLFWLIKQSVFADKRFAQPIPLWIGVLTPFLPLMAYMIGPYLLIFGTHRPAELGLRCGTISLHFRSVPSLCQRCTEILRIATAQGID